MKISKMHLTALHNEEHFQFMVDTKRLVEASGANALNIDQLFPEFTALLDKEDLAIEAIRKSELTDSIFALDAKRDSIYKGFTLLIETYSHSPNQAKATAAHAVQTVIDHYGDFRQKPYKEETAIIYNFLQEINRRCAADITTLEAADWVNDLDTANQAVDGLMEQRFDKVSLQEIVNMRETRKAIDKVYTQLVDRINASVLLNGEAAYSGFINKLNTHVDYYKNVVAIRKGHAAAKKEKGGT